MPIPHAADVTRVFAALFFSGVFWMMVLFLVDTPDTRERSRTFALITMLVAAYFFLETVTHQDAFEVVTAALAARS